jgi:hypothetical protein
MVRPEEGNGLDEGFERRDGADDDGDAGFDYGPEDDVGNLVCRIRQLVFVQCLMRRLTSKIMSRKVRI